MLAHHPITKQDIRIIKTNASVALDAKTLVWIKDTFQRSKLWGRYYCVIDSPNAVEICGTNAIHAVMLSATSHPNDWAAIFPTLFHKDSTAILVGPTKIIEQFQNAKLMCEHTFCIEELYDLYPFLGEPLVSTDSLQKVCVSLAHILRMNRIVWCHENNRDAFDFSLRIQYDAWTSSHTNAVQTIPYNSSDECIPRTWLIQQYFSNPSIRRNKELKQCLDNNLECAHIDNILLLNETIMPELDKYKERFGDKLQSVVIGHRMTYYDVLKTIQTSIPTKDYVIFANSDIWFNDTLSLLWKIPMAEKRLFLALLRHEDKGESTHIFGPRADSQDTWICAASCVDFEIKKDEFEFLFGKPGCDNVIALRMLQKKFNVINPAYSIQTMHLHASAVRTYNPMDILYHTHYLHIEPTYIQPFTVVKNMNDAKYTPAATITNVWNKYRLGKSFARPLLGVDSNAVQTICSMLKRTDWNYSATGDNLWTPPPNNASLYNIQGGSFVSSDGLISNFREIFVGEFESWIHGWSQSTQSSLTPSLHVPHFIACECTSQTLSQWVLYYLPRVLFVRNVLSEAGVRVLPEFLVPQDADIGAFLSDCKWPHADEKGNITVVPLMTDMNYYSENVWTMTPQQESMRMLLTSENIDVLRSLLPIQPSFAADGPVCVFCIEEDTTSVCSRAWAEHVTENLFFDGWTVRYVSPSQLPAERRKAFADANWIIGKGSQLDYIWMAPIGATVMEFMADSEPVGDHIHLAGAAELRYIVGVIKNEPIVNQRQNALLDISKALQMYGFKDMISAAAIKTGLPRQKYQKPTIVLPCGKALHGIWYHCGDKFREMTWLWEKCGFVNIEHSEDTPYCWWGGIGKTLLYDRPTSRWWTDPLPSYQMALFANCTPPGPGNHTLKQSIWGFWGRHPHALESLYQHNLTRNSYDARIITSIFLGKIENGIQLSNRTKHDWSSCVELFSMPIDYTGKEYPYTQDEYLEKLCNTKFGLCLPGFGPKCNREIEYLCCGVVPIITPGVDMKNYLVPPKENIHYFVANSPEEVQSIIRTTTPEQWTMMSVAGREWWRMYASAEGLFRLTWARIEQCKPYLQVGIPSRFL